LNYGDRYRHDEPITSSFVESAVNQVVSKRFVKRQQSGSPYCGIDHLLWRGLPVAMSAVGHASTAKPRGGRYDKVAD